MYEVVNKLLDKKQVKVLPTANNDEELANGFLKYFSEKIAILRAKLEEVQCNGKDRHAFIKHLMYHVSRHSRKQQKRKSFTLSQHTELNAHLRTRFLSMY